MKKFLACLFFFILLLPGQVMAEELSFSPAELDFIKQHPVVHIGVDPLFVPFEFLSDAGQHQGIAADYLALVTQRTGLEFAVVPDLSWPEAYDQALAGQLDLLAAVGKTPEREANFLLTQPYYFFKRIIALQDKTEFSSLADFGSQPVAVQRNSSHHSYLLQQEKINLSLYDSVEAALVAVSTGDEKAFLGNLATANYLAQRNGLTGLRFIAFEAEKQQGLHMAVNPELHQLASILDKAITSISEEEKNTINQRWIMLETKLDYRPLVRIIVYTAGFFLIIAGVSAFWIRQLRSEIKRRQQTQLQLEVANDELAMISMQDGLTGISNRRYFDSFLHKLWGINMREKFPVALIMIDIDRFKNFNDKYGHVAGDDCLKQVAAIIDQTARRAGDFVARYGGEEFAVLLSNTDEAGAASLAERIRQNIAQAKISCPPGLAQVTASLGVAALVSTSEISAADLINAADNALYKAKEQGRNQVVRAGHST